MGGDYSRRSFDPKKHYAAVLFQQGRVLIDNDWNEAEAIRDHAWRTFVRDVLGPSAFPGASEGVGGFAVTTDGRRVTIGAGHAWIDGLLCENEIDVNVTAQPDLPDATLPSEPGTYVAYLEVWQREVTVLEDPSIHEPALGGSDATIRVATLWQVRWRRATVEDDTESSPVASDTTDARLAARGPYVGLDNHLYRIEIHDGGRPRSASIKWSRDNGSTVAAVASWTPRDLVLERNSRTRFVPGEILEVVDRVSILERQPGLIVEVDRVIGDRIHIASSSPDLPAGLVKPLVRRWETRPIALTSRNVTAWLPLDDGVEVRLYGRHFRSGDYWTFPVRTASLDGPGTLDWPVARGRPEACPPHGIDHFRCPLALLEHDGESWRVLQDLRIPQVRAPDLSRRGRTSPSGSPGTR